MKRHTRTAIGGIAVLGAAAALGIWGCTGRDHGMPVLYGNVDIREVNLAFRVGGRITDIQVDEGSPVHAGDLIATLDPEPLQNAVANAEAAVAATGAHAAMLHKGYRGEDVEQAKARLESARAALRTRSSSWSGSRPWCPRARPRSGPWTTPSPSATRPRPRCAPPSRTCAS
jgi:HlyD family secretion protein